MSQLVPFIHFVSFIRAGVYPCFQKNVGVNVIFNRSYSAKPIQPKGAELTPVKTYESAGLQKSQILAENRGLAGIYRWTNKLNSKTYVGSAENLAKRLAIYYRKSELLKSPRPIHKAFLRYGYDNFILEIL